MRRLLVLTAAFLVPFLAAAAPSQPKEIPSTGDLQYSEAAAAVMKTRIGPRPSEAFYLADALEAWGLADEAKALRVYLMHQFVKEARGEAHDPKLTAGKAIDHGRQMDPLAAVAYKDWFGEKWAAMAKGALRPAFPDLRVELPEVIARRSPGARELAPGAWAGFDAPNGREAVYVLAEIENRAPVALPLGAFTMRFEPEPGAGAARFAFDCPLPPDPAVVLVAAGGKRSFHCLSSRDNPGRPSELARALIYVQAYPERAILTPKDFDGPRSVRDRDVDGHIKAIATLSAGKLPPLLARFEECAKANTCGEVKPARDLRKEPVAWTFILFAVVVVYWFLATFRSNRTAALVTWLGCNAFAGWLVSMGPPVRTGGWDAIAYLVIYGGVMLVPTVLVAILYGAVKWLQGRGWWVYPS